jgi:outer membrane receptor protein involved in Fe transport
MSLLRTCHSLIFLMLISNIVFSGTTGKIAGRVTADDTGEGMPGANVIIIGTTVGAATDGNGYFTILNVPPGFYTVRTSVIGYSPITLEGVRVQVDLTTRIDFNLHMEVIAGEEVTVVAQRNPVQEDVSTSVASFSGDEVNEMPFTTVTEVVGQQAGVQDGLVIRGGDADEALFQLDGLTLRDPRNNKPISGIALSSVQEVSIERGGFNAEYGQVRSGIVKVVTKEGAINDYSGLFTFKFSPPAAKYFGISPFDPKSVYLRPYLDDAVCWTGTQTGWKDDPYTQRQYPTFDGWNTISERLMTDDDPTNDLTPAAAQQLFKWQHRKKEPDNQPDYNVDAGFGGPVPVIGKKLGNLRFYASYRRDREMYVFPLTRQDYLDEDSHIKLTSDINPAIKLNVSALYGKSYNIAMNGTEQAYSTQFMRTPEEVVAPMNQSSQIADRIFGTSYYSLANVSNYALTAKLTHVLNPSTFYEVSIDHLSRSYQTGPTRPRNLQRRYEVVDGYFVDEAPNGFSPEPTSSIGDGIFFGGHTSTTRDSTRISATTFKIDLTSQVNLHHLIKTGFEFAYNDLNFDYGVVNQVFPESNQWVKMSKYPVRSALYLQDKLEVEGLVVNAGLRLDYSNSNSEWVALTPFDKAFYSSNYSSNETFRMDKAKADISLSPRLGISHPITQNSKLFFNYGHFKQLPTYEQLFRLSRGALNQVTYMGNPNLVQAKTISYELGYDHALFETYLVQLAAFYNDIKDQQAYSNYLSADGSMNYYAANNNSYKDIRGFELTVRKTAGRWLSGFVNYTYQVTTSGFFGTDVIYQNPSEQRDYNRDTRHRYQFRPIPQPYARANISIMTPAEYGPRVFGLAPLGFWRLNIIGDWRTGGWTTWKTEEDKTITQNVQLKDSYNLSLRFTKTFDFKAWEITCFVDVENALNIKRLSLLGFYDATDFQDYMRSLHLPASQYYNNIVGNDKVGEFRDDDVAFQPIEIKGNINEVQSPDARVIYFDRATKKYMNYINGGWSEVKSGRMQQILDNKAYIDMPNQTSFNFLNPRQFFFGMRLSFKL